MRAQAQASGLAHALVLDTNGVVSAFRLFRGTSPEGSPYKHPSLTTMERHVFGQPTVRRNGGPGAPYGPRESPLNRGFLAS